VRWREGITRKHLEIGKAAGGTHLTSRKRLVRGVRHEKGTVMFFFLEFLIFHLALQGSSDSGKKEQPPAMEH